MKDFLQNIHSQLSWMNLQTISLIGSFIATVILRFIVIPVLKRFKIGQVVRDDGPKEHLKKTGTPTMGGIMMLAVIIIASLIIGQV